MKERCIIIDLDGTLADIKHRRDQLTQNNDWKKFNSEMHLDRLNLWCKEIIEKFRESHEILIVTGRSQNFSDTTEKWLLKHEVSFNRIFYREAEDYRDDTIIKKEIFENKIEPYFLPLFVVDDRRKVVKMWRDLGLVCLQCDIGDL